MRKIPRLTREIRIRPGYDKRNPDPKKNYGVHGCEVMFYLHSPGKIKSVYLVLYTDWLPLNVQKEEMGSGVIQQVIGEQPMASDLGYHSPVPFYDGQSKRPCDISKNGYCYSDGSGLEGERVRNIMLEEGDDGVWRELETYWREVFVDRTHAAGFGEQLAVLSDALKGAA